ncbi:MAG: DUF1398 family protein [Bacteroidia bacterium]|nr:DUF1398 family protein [Bacteroidia bacterium]
MFTIDQIAAAHSKVKSGADFPNYIKEIKQLGVTHYETFASDSRADFYGANNFKVCMPAKFSPIAVSDNCNVEQFKNDLKNHQQGKTDYLTWRNDTAKSGIEKWKVDLHQMTCTYYDTKGNEILTENIPQ